MNWISQNKFLSGFIGFMLVAGGALGFLLFEAISNYSDVHTKYTTAVTKLDSLQKLIPYPNDENLKNYEGQEDVVKQAVNKLEQNIAQVQFPLDATITPSVFQDKLRAAVGDAKDKAATGKIELPDKFALGFDQYLTGPPVQAAAPSLDRQLKAIQFILDELLEGGGTESITKVDRAQLPEESPKGKPSTELVVKHPVEITFIGSQDKVRKLLNDLAESKKQFYIVRLVQINTAEGKDKPISKADAYKNRNQPSGAPRFVLGDEKLEVTLSLEIVNFNPPQK
jgi:hypothetical protein